MMGEALSSSGLIVLNGRERSFIHLVKKRSYSLQSSYRLSRIASPILSLVAPSCHTQPTANHSKIVRCLENPLDNVFFYMVQKDLLAQRDGEIIGGSPLRVRFHMSKPVANRYFTMVEQ